MSADDLLSFAAFVVGWIALQRFVLRGRGGAPG
jgi:hypothetical protein